MTAERVEKEFIKAFCLKVYAVCQKMGWTLDYVLEMNLEQFNQIYEMMEEVAREEQRIAETERLKATLGRTTLR